MVGRVRREAYARERGLALLHRCRGRQLGVVTEIAVGVVIIPRVAGLLAAYGTSRKRRLQRLMMTAAADPAAMPAMAPVERPDPPAGAGAAVEVSWRRARGLGEDGAGCVGHRLGGRRSAREGDNRTLRLTVDFAFRARVIVWKMVVCTTEVVVAVTVVEMTLSMPVVWVTMTVVVESPPEF